MIDMSRKITLCAWHPKENTFAVAKHNSLFVYSERKAPQIANTYISSSSWGSVGVLESSGEKKSNNGGGSGPATGSWDM